MAAREEKITFGELTPLITERETNIGGNKKRERLARFILTTFIQIYTLNIFRKKFCPTNKFGKCVLVTTKLIILASFFAVNYVKYLLNFDFSILTQSYNTTATNQGSIVKSLIADIIRNFLVFFISLTSLFYLYFIPSIIKEFERISTFIFDKTKICLFVIVPILMLAGAIQDISIFFIYDRSVSNIIRIVIATPIITIYFFLWHTALYVMCVIICSVCDQLYYETLSEIEEAKKFILNKNNINKRENWKESPLPRYFELSKRVSNAANPFRHISCLNILLVFIIFVVISNNIVQRLTVEERLGNYPDIYWMLFLFFHHFFSVLIMISRISNLNTTLTLYSDTILSDIEVQKVLIQTNEKNRDYFSRIREEIQMISSSKVRFTIYFFGDLSSPVLNSIFLLVIPLTISGMFTV